MYSMSYIAITNNNIKQYVETEIKHVNNKDHYSTIYEYSFSSVLLNYTT